MIDETRGSASAMSKLKAVITDVVLLFPLAGLTILGRSVYVRISTTLPAPGAAYIGGLELSESALMTWSPAELVFLLLHEWFHVFGNHAARRGDRDAKTWNIACDYRVNVDVMHVMSWVKPVPQGGHQPPPWVGDKTPEEIYDRLVSEAPPVGGAQSTKTLTNAGLSSEDLNAEELLDPSLENTEEQRDSFVAELCAAEVAMSNAGRNLAEVAGSHIAQRLVDLKRGVVPWGRLILGDMLARMGGSTPTYSPPRRRLYPWLILPSYRDKTNRSLLLGIDVSASISKKLMDVFASSCAAASARAKTTTVVTFDQKLRERFTVTSPKELLSEIKFLTGAHGYTSVRPVFDVAEEIQPSAIAILTDGYIQLPDKEYPRTLWAVPRGGAIPPWGKTHTMEVSW